jgi:hypothetical protein
MADLAQPAALRGMSRDLALEANVIAVATTSSYIQRGAHRANVR